MKTTDEKKMIPATQLLQDLGFRFESKNGTTAIMRKLHELHIKIAEHRPHGRGIQLLITQEEALAAIDRAKKEPAQKNSSTSINNETMKRIEQLCEFNANAIESIARELSITLCRNCGTKRDDGDECHHCGSYSA